MDPSHALLTWWVGPSLPRPARIIMHRIHMAMEPALPSL